MQKLCHVVCVFVCAGGMLKSAGRWDLIYTNVALENSICSRWEHIPTVCLASGHVLIRKFVHIHVWRTSRKEGGQWQLDHVPFMDPLPPFVRSAGVFNGATVVVGSGRTFSPVSRWDVKAPLWDGRTSRKGATLIMPTHGADGNGIIFQSPGVAEPEYIIYTCKSYAIVCKNSHVTLMSCVFGMSCSSPSEH